MHFSADGQYLDVTIESPADFLMITSVNFPAHPPRMASTVSHINWQLI